MEKAMRESPDNQNTPGLLPEPPLCLHHYAFVVKDQEVNRHFSRTFWGFLW
jgi:hypothetical protein